MIKRYLIFLVLLVMASVSINAGSWKVHNYYLSSKIQNVYEMGDKIYYVNSGNLYQFDKATSQTVLWNNKNKLSDERITQAYYDWENRLLFLTYFNTNIDIIDADGKVYNVSNLKDAIFNVHNYTLSDNSLSGYTGGTINDITFAHGIAYVAVDYGYLTIDEATKRVVDNVNLSLMSINVNINSVAVIGNTMMILTNTHCFYGPVGSSRPFSDYTRKTGSFSKTKVYPVDETAVFLLGSTALYRLDFSSGTATLSQLVAAAPTSVQKSKNGFIANFAGKNFYYTFDAKGKNPTQASTSAGFATSDPMGNGQVWINDNQGLHLNGSAVSYSLNALSTDEPYWLKYNATMDKLYAATSALNGKNRKLEAETVPHVINTYDGEQWAYATPYASPGAAYEFVFDPLDPQTYVRASWRSGVH